MKRLVVLIFILVIGLIFATPLRAGPNDFSFSSFSGEYFLDHDSRGVGQMTVRETLVAEFPDFDQNHGIFRSIPKTYNDYDLNLEIQSVNDGQGQAYQYTTTIENDQLVLKIGDPFVFERGTTTYEISYSMENIIEFTEAQDQFFWDINGSGWSQPFDQVLASIYVPEDLARNLNNNLVCFSGEFGSSQQNCTVESTVVGNTTIINSSAANLQPDETLSVAVGFNKDTFYQDAWPARRRLILQIVGVILPLATGAIMTNRWRERGRDPKGKGVIIPQYQPPKGFDAIDANVLINERLETAAISSSIIEMAIKGVLKIYESEKKQFISKKNEYELELVKYDSNLSSSQKKVLDSLFGETSKPGSKIDLSSQANKLYKTQQSLVKSVPKKLHADGYFQNEPAKVRNKYIGLALMVGIVGIVLAASGLMLLPGLGLIASAVIVGVFANAMPAKTPQGVELRDYLLGLKDYMKLAEADRIKYLQSPEGVKQYGDPTKQKSKVNLFETLLPYAMMFGIEKDWAKQFEHLYKQPPEWFSSATGHFTTAHLANSLGSFNGVTATAFSPPSSSGSSGGGFSGGGGGGGGGGGW